ncbi:MAG: DegT/DnrJ/EryC1/StrS family aminotransferase [Candidatus Zixiibacteriota bacterium]
MAVPLIDIHRQHDPIQDKLDAAIKAVFAHGRFILGPEVKELEERIAKLCRVKHAIGVASGTDALQLALHAAGVGPGDEVITSAFSFFASAGVISRLGAKPVFAEIDIDTFNLDPAKLERRITDKTKAIMPVHLFGQCADMDAIFSIALNHKVKIIEDAAQAIGSIYYGRPAGSLGDAGCFSFFPTKNLGCAGDGGMIVTNNDELAETMRMLRVHGGKSEYHHDIVGYNSRLDTLQAAILNVKLDYLQAWTEARRKNAARYDKLLADVPVVTPVVAEERYHIFHQYTIMTDKRDELQAHLHKKGVGCKVYYPIPFHMQKCFADLGYTNGQFPLAEKAGNQVLSLPIFGEMTEAEQDEVVAAIKEFFS